MLVHWTSGVAQGVPLTLYEPRASDGRTYATSGAHTIVVVDEMAPSEKITMIT